MAEAFDPDAWRRSVDQKLKQIEQAMEDLRAYVHTTLNRVNSLVLKLEKERVQRQGEKKG